MIWFPLKIPSWIRWPSPSTARHVLYGVLIGFSLSLTSTSFALYIQSRRRQRLAAKFEPRPIELRSDEVLSGVTGLIGVPTPVSWFSGPR
jgi:cysteine synthase A